MVIEAWWQEKQQTELPQSRMEKPDKVEQQVSLAVAAAATAEFAIALATAQLFKASSWLVTHYPIPQLLLHPLTEKRLHLINLSCSMQLTRWMTRKPPLLQLLLTTAPAVKRLASRIVPWLMSGQQRCQPLGSSPHTLQQQLSLGGCPGRERKSARRRWRRAGCSPALRGYRCDRWVMGMQGVREGWMAPSDVIPLEVVG